MGFHFVALSGYNGERAKGWRERRRSCAQLLTKKWSGDGS